MQVCFYKNLKTVLSFLLLEISAFILISFFSLTVTNVLPVTYSTNTTLTADLRLHPTGTTALFDTNGVTLDGDGFFCQFPLTESVVLTVNDSVTATLEDLFLKDLKPAHIDLNTSGELIFGDGTAVVIPGDIDLGSDTWQFGGSSRLLGKGRAIDLSAGGVIQVESGGSLTLENINFTGVGASSIVCADDTATIKFKNVNLTIPTRFDFGSGAFSVQEGLSLLGGGIFSYESAYASTILDNSWLKMSDSMTFSYDPAQGAEQPFASAQNLVMTNTSSKLILDSATLKVTTTAMQLAKGSLELHRNNVLEADSPDTVGYDDGLVLGNVDDPLNIFLDNGCFSINSGSLNYQNEPPVLYGDSLVLRNLNYGFYLYTNGEVFFHLGSSRLIAGVDTFPVIEEESYWYILHEDAASGGSEFVNAETKVLSGDDIRLLNKEYASDPYPLRGAARSASGVPPVSTPKPPYYLAYTRPNGGVQNTDAIIEIVKVGGSIGDPIFVGDSVTLRFSDTNRDHYLSSENIAFVNNSVPVKEVFAYYNNGLEPPGTDHYWVIDRKISADYLNF